MLRKCSKHATVCDLLQLGLASKEGGLGREGNCSNLLIGSKLFLGAHVIKFCFCVISIFIT